MGFPFPHLCIIVVFPLTSPGSQNSPCLPRPGPSSQVRARSGPGFHIPGTFFTDLSLSLLFSSLKLLPLTTDCWRGTGRIIILSVQLLPPAARNLILFCRLLLHCCSFPLPRSSQQQLGLGWRASPNLSSQSGAIK